MTTENPVNSKRARHLLADCRECGACAGRGCAACAESGWLGKPWGETLMCAIKKKMGADRGVKLGRLIFLSEVREFLKHNPGFKAEDAYPRKRAPN